MQSPEPLPPTTPYEGSADFAPPPYSYGSPPPGYQAPGPMYLEPPNSPLAISSLILGITGFFLLPVIGSIAAVILGHMAQGEIARSNGTLGGRSFATVGLVLGYVGLALIALFIILIIVIAIVGFAVFQQTHGATTS